MQAVVRAIQSGRLRAEPGVVISNNADSGALRFAKAEGIPWRHLSGRTHRDANALDEAILATLRSYEVDLVLLLGYMKLLGPKTVAAYKGRALNIHPALLPKFGGRGMYGLRVHQAALTAGEKTTGVTIHLVDEEYDHGEIIAQCTVPIQKGDGPETLAARVLKREHSFLVETLEKIIDGRIKLPGL
jgi:phosphoribosylglycinamide formyltransferase-1